jgi:hypothetical protein
MDARRRFLGHAFDRGGVAAIPAGMRFQATLDRREQHFLFFVGRLVEESGVALFGAQAEMDQRGGVAAVVENHVGLTAVRPFENAVRIFPIIDEALALDGEDWGAGGGDRRGGVVLRRIDVAGRPANVCAKGLQRFDQHRGLDGHMQGAGDARALQRLGERVFGARRHQARHFGLRDGDFLAPPSGQSDIGDDEILRIIGHVKPHFISPPP